MWMKSEADEENNQRRTGSTMMIILPKSNKGVRHMCKLAST